MPPRTTEYQLLWNVQALAIRKGIHNPAELGRLMQTHRQQLYPIWRGESVSITLEVLGRLARVLEVAPGSWFVWAEDQREGRAADGSLATMQVPVLRWDIKRHMDRLHMNLTEFSFFTGLYQATIKPIIEGTAQGAYLTTLARLALVIQRSEPSFSIGGLFTWSPHAAQSGTGTGTEAGVPGDAGGDHRLAIMGS